MHVCALKLTLECSVVVCTFLLMSRVHVPIYVHVQMISELSILYILNYIYIYVHIYVISVSEQHTRSIFQLVALVLRSACWNSTM